VPDTGLQAAIAEHLVADGRRIVITGAGGWLGLATLELLHAALGDALPKRVAAFGSDTRALRLRDGTQVLQRPLADMAWLPTKPTLVLHLAFLTKDRAESMDEDAYRAANHAIGDTVLNALDSIGTEAVFLASSGAAALTDAPAPAMHLYGAMKREDEERFAHWAQTPNRRAVIARIHNISGPHMNKHGAYALASFMLDALAGRPIAVRAPRPVIRSYVAIRELMGLVFAMLLDAPRRGALRQRRDPAGTGRYRAGGGRCRPRRQCRARAHHRSQCRPLSRRRRALFDASGATRA
jgi:nucleoside-diphosphate-sugar epimerase